jgi:outer membrane protein TolC
LASNIYASTVFKYKEGVGSALELLQAETDLKTGQTNYLNALYDLVMAKIDLKKALGQEILKP